MYVLDTNIVSELRRNKPHGAVLAWLDTTSPSDLYLAAATIGELQTGVEKLRSAEPSKADEIEHWIDSMLLDVIVLPADVHVYRLWAKIMFGKPRDVYEDAFIAATAMIRGFTVVTRNVRDFSLFDVDVFDPFRFSA